MNNWYKISQNMSFEAWIGRETSNYDRQLSPEHLRILKEWYDETKPDLANMNRESAIFKAHQWIEQREANKPLKENLTKAHVNKKELARLINLYGDTNAVTVHPTDIEIVKIEETRDEGAFGRKGQTIYKITFYYPYFRKDPTVPREDVDVNVYDVERVVSQALTKDGQFIRIISMA